MSYDSEIVVCGEINMRNRFGGYGGYAPFISSRIFLYIDSEETERADSAGVVFNWPIYCTSTKGARDLGPVRWN
jgi:hypothetical protein